MSTDFLALCLFCFNIRQHGRQSLYFELHVDGRKFHYWRPQVVHRCSCLHSSKRHVALHCRDRKARAASAQSFALWQQATIEITQRDHSFIACSRHMCIWVLFFAHIPFVVNRTFNATLTERLQQHIILLRSSEIDLSFVNKNIRFDKQTYHQLTNFLFCAYQQNICVLTFLLFVRHFCVTGWRCRCGIVSLWRHRCITLVVGGLELIESKFQFPVLHVPLFIYSQNLKNTKSEVLGLSSFWQPPQW